MRNIVLDETAMKLFLELLAQVGEGQLRVAITVGVHRGVLDNTAMKMFLESLAHIGGRGGRGYRIS